MNILGLHIGKAENRQATDYAAAVTQALQDAATNSTAKADALAVVEMCVTLIADPVPSGRNNRPYGVSQNALHGS